MAGFTVLGVAARLVRFAVHFPLWEDECFLGVSLATRSYRELLTPLDYHQVATAPYLWMQKAVIDALGFNEWSLRLVAFVAGLASLWLFRRVVTRLLDGWARVAAYGCFAVAYPGIRYAAEAKPYGLDLFLALLVIVCVTEWRATRRDAWLWGLAAVAPVAVATSWPGSLLVATASLMLLPELRHSRARTVAAWASTNALALAAGLGSMAMLGPARSELAWMREYWREDFLPIREFWRVPAFLVDHLAGDYLAIPVGGGNFGSLGTLVLAGVGVSVFWRSRRWAPLALTFLPMALHLVLSALQLYPFGGAVKFSMYEMPMISVMVGAGIWALVSAWPARSPRGGLVRTVALSALALVAIVSIARDVAYPYKTVSDRNARQWAQEFWARADAADHVDLKTDLGIDFSPATFRELSWSAMYLANRRIYASRPRHVGAAAGPPVRWDRPVVVAEYHDVRQPYDVAAKDRWLSEMAKTHTLVRIEDVPMARYDKRGRLLPSAGDRAR